jgi:hypothetical protein
VVGAECLAAPTELQCFLYFSVLDSTVTRKKMSSSLLLNSDTRSLKIATVMFLYLSGDVS